MSSCQGGGGKIVYILKVNFISLNLQYFLFYVNSDEKDNFYGNS